MPWRREWLPTPVFLPGEFHGQRSLEDPSPWGRKESDTAEQLSPSLSPGMLLPSSCQLGWGGVNPRRSSDWRSCILEVSCCQRLTCLLLPLTPNSAKPVPVGSCVAGFSPSPRVNGQQGRPGHCGAQSKEYLRRKGKLGEAKAIISEPGAPPCPT